MDASAFLPDSVTHGVRFLRQELAPFPWRVNLALRCVLASAIVIVLSMTFEVPALALSLLCVFYTTQSNVVITRLAGFLFIAASTLAVGISLVLLIFTFDHPLLRITAASLVLFISAYLMRILKIGTMFFVVAIVVIYLQSLIDQNPEPESMVRLTLWVWVVVNYAIFVSLLVNTWLLPIEPAQQLKAEIHRQLEAVQAQLLGLETGAGPAQAPDPTQALTGLLAMQKLLKFAAMRDAQYRSDEAYQLALIASVARLSRAANDMPAAVGMPLPSLASSWRALRTECAVLDMAVQAGARYQLAGAPPPVSDGMAGMADMWRTLADAGARNAALEQQGQHADPMVAADALTNPAYLRFALKSLLGVLIGYVFYNAVQWQGIHTIMLSCLIVALPSLGASTQKAWLRIGGALVGSALALFMVVFVIPRIDSIFGLLLMALPVVGLGAWIAAGSERISYAGIQVVFTFSLALLERFGPTTDLTEIRDRMIGIVLGVGLALAIQTLIWPEGEGDMLRQKLAGLLRSVGTLLRWDARADAEPGHLTYMQQELRTWTEYGTTQAVLARVAIEPDWNEGANQAVTARAQAVLAAAQELIRAGDTLQGQLAQPAPGWQARAAADAVRAAVADELDRYAAGLEADPPTAGTVTPAVLPAPEPAPGQAPQPVLAAAQDLIRQLGGLPDWTQPAPEPVTIRLPLRQ